MRDEDNQITVVRTILELMKSGSLTLREHSRFLCKINEAISSDYGVPNICYNTRTYGKCLIGIFISCVGPR